jgi:hypothetical protein
MAYNAVVLGCVLLLSCPPRPTPQVGAIELINTIDYSLKLADFSLAYAFSVLLETYTHMVRILQRLKIEL